MTHVLIVTLIIGDTQVSPPSLPESCPGGPPDGRARGGALWGDAASRRRRSWGSLVSKAWGPSGTGRERHGVCSAMLAGPGRSAPPNLPAVPADLSRTRCLVSASAGAHPSRRTHSNLGCCVLQRCRELLELSWSLTRPIRRRCVAEAPVRARDLGLWPGAGCPCAAAHAALCHAPRRPRRPALCPSAAALCQRPP